MITLPAAVQVYLCTIACDMRRGFDGLRMLAATVVGVDPMGGHLFVFCSRRADRLKILYWDRDGWALWSKRLERGTYAFPFETAGRRQITGGELGALLEGIDLRGATKRKRYVPRLQPGPEARAAALTKPL
jgi:transposase